MIMVREALKKISVDFFHAGRGGPDQIHTFLKVLKKGVFWRYLRIFALFWSAFEVWRWSAYF